MTRLDAYKHLNSANGIYTTLWDASGLRRVMGEPVAGGCLRARLTKLFACGGAADTPKCDSAERAEVRQWAKPMHRKRTVPGGNPQPPARGLP